MKKIGLFKGLLLLLALLLTFPSCQGGSDLGGTPTGYFGGTTSGTTAGETTSATTQGTQGTGSGTQTLPPLQELLDSIPPYTSSNYAEVNGNVPYFATSDYTTTSYEDYSELDLLGRCGTAMACLGKDLMPTDERGDISGVRPTGWINTSYDGTYLYNRSHLIGWQLAGENANEKNIITGTSTMNQRGMLPFENQVADYIKETNNHVMYRVTPVFKGDELVARGVLMEAYSVEDNGDGICFCVFLYNVQPGIVIDYATGASHKEGEETTTPTKEEKDYILNTSSKKFHDPDCSSVSKMSDKNKAEYHGYREDLIAEGYLPCGVCNP